MVQQSAWNASVRLPDQPRRQRMEKRLFIHPCAMEVNAVGWGVIDVLRPAHYRAEDHSRRGHGNPTDLLAAAIFPIQEWSGAPLANARPAHLVLCRSGTRSAVQ